MSKNRRAQAAMEFLMTYGWALLVVLVAIGALAYLGVLNPTRFVPDRCDIAPGISCNTQQVKANGGAGGTSTDYVYVKLQNGLGETLTDVSLNLSAATVGGSSTCASSNRVILGSNWLDGTTAEFGFTCGTPTTWSVGDKFKSTMFLEYNASGVQRAKQGQLTATIE